MAGSPPFLDSLCRDCGAFPPGAACACGSRQLEAHLWRMAEKLARRLREQGLAAGGVVLKLKASRFAGRTRAQRLPGPTAFRLISLGAHPVLPGRLADQPDLADPDAPRRAALHARFGDGVIGRGRGPPAGCRPVIRKCHLCRK